MFWSQPLLSRNLKFYFIRLTNGLSSTWAKQFSGFDETNYGLEMASFQCLQ